MRFAMLSSTFSQCICKIKKLSSQFTFEFCRYVLQRGDAKQCKVATPNNAKPNVAMNILHFGLLDVVCNVTLQTIIEVTRHDGCACHPWLAWRIVFMQSHHLASLSRSIKQLHLTSHSHHITYSCFWKMSLTSHSHHIHIKQRPRHALRLVKKQNCANTLIHTKMKLCDMKLIIKSHYDICCYCIAH